MQFINSVSKPLIALETHEQDEIFKDVANALWRLASPNAPAAQRPEPAPNPPPAQAPAAIPKGSWTPRQTLRPVHRPIKWYAVSFATASLLTASLLSWIVGSGNHAAGVFSEAIFFSALASMLGWLMVAKFWDAQFILSTVRALLLLTVFYLICGSICAYFPHGQIHNLFVIAALVFGVVALVWGGHAKWYWNEKQFGDLALELIPVALFAAGGSIGVGHLMGA